MTPDRKHPSAAFWITAALVAVLVAYPLSLGPAIWLRDHGLISTRQYDSLCAPAVDILEMIPDAVGTELYDALDRYVILWE